MQTNTNSNDFRHPLTGDIMQQLSYSPSDFEMVKAFIDEYFNRDYTLSFFDMSTKKTFELNNDIISEIKNVISSIVSYISSLEHTFVHWIGVNSFTNSYVIAIDITRGRLKVGHIYHFDMATETLIDES